VRVTNNWLVASTMRNLNRLRADSAKAEQQVSSGLAFTKMSENVVGGSEVLKLQHRLGQLDTWSMQQNDTLQWLQSTEQHLNDMSDALSRLKELALRARNDAMEGQRSAIATEAREIGNQILELLNGRNGDKALFGGYQTQPDPFSMDWTTGTLTYNGDTGQLLREVGPNTTLQANITGDQFTFNWVDSTGTAQTGDMLQTVFQMINEMIPSAPVAGAPVDNPPSQDTLTKLDAAFDQVNSLRTQVGARHQRIIQLESKLNDTYEYLQTALANVQGADPAKAILELEQASTAYKAAMAVAGRILPVTLADFLR
jgi:flagellar hook-associated protein 3 FlgL